MDENAQFPHDELRGALGDEHPERATVDALQRELSGSQPDRGTIDRHVGRLRSVPEIAAIVANWWDDPRTQHFFADLGATGL
jgi:hypothetical protein